MFPSFLSSPTSRANPALFSTVGSPSRSPALSLGHEASSDPFQRPARPLRGTVTKVCETMAESQAKAANRAAAVTQRAMDAKELNDEEIEAVVEQMRANGTSGVIAKAMHALWKVGSKEMDAECRE